MEDNQGDFSALWEWHQSELSELIQTGPALHDNTEPEPMELDPTSPPAEEFPSEEPVQDWATRYVPPAQDWPTRYVEFDNGEGAWLYDEEAVPFCVAPSELTLYQDVPMADTTNHEGPVMAMDDLPSQPTPEPLSPLMAQQQIPPAEATTAYPTIDSAPGKPDNARPHPCPNGCGRRYYHARGAAQHAKTCGKIVPLAQRTKDFPCPANAHRGCDQMFFYAGVARKHGEICAQRCPCPNNVNGANGCTRFFKYEVEANRHAAFCNGTSKAEKDRVKREAREAAVRRLSLGRSRN